MMDSDWGGPGGKRFSLNVSKHFNRLAVQISVHKLLSSNSSFMGLLMIFPGSFQTFNPRLGLLKYPAS